MRGEVHSVPAPARQDGDGDSAPLGLEGCSHGDTRLISFEGRDRVHAQRLAVNWWYAHRTRLGLCLVDFLRRCRREGERTIVFYMGVFQAGASPQ